MQTHEQRARWRRILNRASGAAPEAFDSTHSWLRTFQASMSDFQ